MMPSVSFPYRLYLVLSEPHCQGRDYVQVAEQAIRGGVDIIQWREKVKSGSASLEKALRLKELTDRYRIPLIINDHLDIAREVDAFGIHVGNQDLSPVEVRSKWGPEKCIGYSLEAIDQFKNERSALADYLAVSPVFSTSTKTDTITEWGLEGIRRLRQLANKPLVAIGNINQWNLRSVIEAGADCVAVVSAICAAKDPQKAASELKNEGWP